MLTKLLKYEFRSTGRVFLPLYGGIMLLTLFTRLFVWMGDYSNILAIPAGLLTVLYVLSLIGMFAVTYVVLLRRFYTSLIGDEGYLSFTLPVKPWQHITSKLITSVVWVIATAAAAGLSLLLMFVSNGFFKDLYDFIRVLIGYSQISYVMLVLEFIITALVSVAASMLMFYASMAIGQLVNGHKVAGSVAAFLVSYFVTQILLGIGMFAFGAVDPATWEVINTMNAVQGVALMLLLILVIQAVFGTLYFIITNYVFKNKLNLE